MTSSVVLNGAPFQIVMNSESLNVIFIPRHSLAKAAWWILREYSYNSRNRHGFSSLINDDDGLSIVCDANAFASLECLDISGMFVSPQKWKAFVINVIGSASEVPGAIYYLSKSLSIEGMSILHISTYQSEVFLVQEPDIEKAIAVFHRLDNPKDVENIFNQKRIDMENIITNENKNDENLVDSKNENSDKDTSLSQSLEDTAAINKREEFILQVLPDHVILTKLSDQFSFNQISSELVS